MKGFQRAIIETHVDDIVSYFEVEENISPTAVVVAFKPGQVKLNPIPGFETSPNAPQILSITIDTPDFDSIDIYELARRAADALGQHLGDTHASPPPNIENDSQYDGSAHENADQDEDDPESAESLLSLEESHLQQFISQLRSRDWIKKAIQDDEQKLRTTLCDLLKPATIVDGQHRTRGAARCEQQIPFAVVALIEAPWKEEVFQFVVINQRAKPIQAEFLSAIVSSSLSEDDILDLKSRLEQAGVNLLNTRIIDLVNGSPESPFKGMIDFKITGSEGKLKFTGMLQLAKRFMKLQTHDPKRRFNTFFKQIFQSCVDGKNLTENRENWQNQEWFTYFCSLWTTVQQHFNQLGFSNLWEPGSNLLKIVTLHELQNLFLDWLFKRMDRIENAEQFRKLTRQFLTNLNGSFFTDVWQLKSLQSETGRRYLRQALTNAIEQQDYRRNDPLFKGLSSKPSK
jgi:hypothetical protein